MANPPAPVRSPLNAREPGATTFMALRPERSTVPLIAPPATGDCSAPFPETPEPCGWMYSFGIVTPTTASVAPSPTMVPFANVLSAKPSPLGPLTSSRPEPDTNTWPVNVLLPLSVRSPESPFNIETVGPVPLIAPLMVTLPGNGVMVSSRPFRSIFPANSSVPFTCSNPAVKPLGAN